MAYRRKRFYRRRRVTRKKSTRSVKRIVRKAVKAVRPELRYSDQIRVSDIKDTPDFSSPWIEADYKTQNYDNPLPKFINNGALKFYNYPGVDAPYNARVVCLTNMWYQKPWETNNNGSTDDTGTGGVFHDSMNGWKVNAKFLRLRLKLSATSTLTDTTILNNARCRFRVMLLIQKDYTTTFGLYPPIITELLQYPDGIGASNNDVSIDSPLLDRFKDRFGVLYDRVYTVSNSKGAGWINVKINKKLRQTIQFNPINDRVVAVDNKRYNAAARGSMYLVIMSASDTGQGSPTITPTFDLMSRIYYTDP